MQLLFYQRAPCPAPLLHQLYRKSCLSCRIEPRRHQWKSCWTRRDKQFLYDKQEQRCLGCLRNFRFNDLTVDHIWAVRWGGADEIKNWQLLCRRCNSTKGARGMAYLRRALLDKGVLVGTFQADLPLDNRELTAKGRRCYT